ncbi:MAG: hypothetical protein KKB31_05735 [Nanoarchaeota archaeon]|nr:hypothetical protein [Nanoarchaeota archaeon]
MNIQEKILRELYLSRKRETPKELSNATNLSITQIYKGLWGLKNRGMIKVTREIEKIGHKNPPHGKISIIFNEKSITKAKIIFEKASRR